MNDPSALPIRTLAKDAPKGRVEVIKLRPKRIVSFNNSCMICSDNPHYGGLHRSPMSIEVPALRCITVSHARIQMPQHLIRIDDALYHDLCISRHAQWRSQAARRIAGHTRIATNSTFHNFYHWISECLPSLAFHASQGAQVLMPTLAAPWQASTIKAAGLTDVTGRVAGREVIEVESLEFPSTAMHHKPGTCSGGLWDDEAVETFARIGARPEVAALEGRFPNRIFISRRDAGKRPFDDEVRVAKLLHPLGFEEVVLSELDTFEQVALFRGAQVIVAAHGAGLVQIGFCRPGARVFEIQHPSCRSDMFMRIAMQFGLGYAMYQEFDPSIPADARMLSWGIRDFRRLKEILFRFFDIPD